jgi:asparagine synthase (glutamine-hydrolysing)
MCGIAGIIKFDNSKIDQASLIAMRDSMKQRGPDDAGIYSNDERTIAFAHRRLSIIDLSPSGHQPMANEDGSIWITFNGEIYNFPDLKKELQNNGYKFKSASDTEVIIKAYQKWGEDAFDKLNGMFAFALYDKNKGITYLCRDHAGIKPLYYSISQDCLLFASEVKAFKSFNRDWEQNQDWKILFLTFGYIPEPHTYLKDVYMLPKGCLLKLDMSNHTHSMRKYTCLKFSNDIKDLNEAKTLLRETFGKAVKRHLISDAPIGVFLSGGIDSSLIAGLSAKYTTNLETLSIIFDEKDYCEENYQQLMAKRLKSRHRAYRVGETDFLNCIEDAISAMDQPTTDGVNTYFISKYAKEAGLKVVLSGIGGDELFGGYSSFNKIDAILKLKLNNKISKNLFKLGEFLWTDKFKKSVFLSFDFPLSIYLFFRGFYTPKTISNILDCSQTDVYRAIEKIDIPNDGPLASKNLLSYLEAGLYMQNQLLRDSDFMSMRHSLELRVPFLDKELMNLVFSIDEGIKFHGKQLKYLLCESFRDILPDEIIFRKKMGFTFPFEKWMRNNLPLFSNKIGKRNKTVDKISADFGKGRLGWARFWSLIVLNYFKEGK